MIDLSVPFKAQKNGLIRKCHKPLDNNDDVLKSFYAFILPFMSTVLLFAALHLICS